MIGLEKGRVKLEPFQDDWKEAFETEKSTLQQAFETDCLAIEHIGSTAIEGMLAKPIIDLMVAVPALKFDLFEPLGGLWRPLRLEHLGYEYRPYSRTDDRIFWAKGPRENRTHYLSVTPAGSEFWHTHLKFLVALRQQPELAEEYKRLRVELAQRFPDNRAAYTNGKAEFITKVLRRAYVK